MNILYYPLYYAMKNGIWSELCILLFFWSETHACFLKSLILETLCGFSTAKSICKINQFSKISYVLRYWLWFKINIILVLLTNTNKITLQINSSNFLGIKFFTWLIKSTQNLIFKKMWLDVRKLRFHQESELCKKHLSVIVTENPIS